MGVGLFDRNRARAGGSAAARLLVLTRNRRAGWGREKRHR